jgi:hypothetical protein
MLACTHERIILKGILILSKDVGYIHLAQDRDQYWALLKKLMDVCVP